MHVLHVSTSVDPCIQCTGLCWTCVTNHTIRNLNMLKMIQHRTKLMMEKCIQNGVNSTQMVQNGTQMLPWRPPNGLGGLKMAQEAPGWPQWISKSPSRTRQAKWQGQDPGPNQETSQVPGKGHGQATGTTSGRSSDRSGSWDGPEKGRRPKIAKPWLQFI